MTGLDSTRLHKVQPIPIEIDDILKQPRHNTTITLRRIITGLSRVQKYSGYIFGTFVAIHVTAVVVVPCVTDLIIPSSIKQEVFEISRAVYQSTPFFEQIAIIGASITHIIAGISIRLLRWKLNSYKLQHVHKHPTTTCVNERSDDIGLGGITSLIGLGYRKSIISTLVPGLSPLAFSGYILIPLLGYHFFKFRYLPFSVDGDSSLINLDYISYYLNISLQKWGNTFNFWALSSLVWVMAYHSVSGWLKFNGKFSSKWKRAGYVVINVASLLSIISIIGFKNGFSALDKDGFMGKSFIKYLTSSFI